MTQIALPELEPQARLVFHPGRKLSEDEYFEFCQANSHLRIERTAKGEIVIVPPAGAESAYRSGDVSAQLRYWARRDGRGKAFDSSAEYILPSGAAPSPDASWVSNASLARFSKDQRKKFLQLSPEFVVEVMSPSDRLAAAKRKMENWIADGVQLGWLIDGDARSVYIYRPGREVERRTGVAQVAGEGPVEGFVLEMGDIWAGL